MKSIICFSERARWIVLLIGIVLSGFGIAVTTSAGLGTTPVSSLPYVLSMCTPLTIGMWIFLFNLLYVALQKAMLGKNFALRQFLQIPPLLLFGPIIDVGMFLMKPFAGVHYSMKLVMLFAGSLLVAFGIGIQLIAELPCLPADSIIHVFSTKYKTHFGVTKGSFDLALSAAAIILSLLCFHEVRGVREGTIISALLVGFLISHILPRLRSARAACPLPTKEAK